ncbi:MAG: right-handed parallel beta-helix repeat-containing protein [Candidatus Micrarchaeota archaeon]
MRIIVIFLLGLLFLSGVSFSLTNVVGCMNITSSDYYILNNDLLGANITVYGGGQRACLRVAANDVTIDCDGYSITNNGAAFASGIQVDGVTATSYNNITIMNCPNISVYTNSGVYVDYTGNSTIRNVTSYGNTQNGFYLDESHNNSISNCTAHSNNNRGFLIWNSDSNNVSNSISFNNAIRGFELYYAKYNRFENCTAYDTAATQDYGFYFNTDCDYAYLLNTSSYGHVNSGYYIGGTSQHYININDSVAYGNAERGFYLGSTFWMNMSNNSAYDNGWDGFYIDTPYYLLFHYNKAFGNGLSGWWSNRPWTENASHNILYNNTVAELSFVSTTLIRFKIYNLTIDNPYGGFQNYTTLDIDDRIYNGETTTIKWDTNASALPAGRGSFEQKIVDITATPDTAVLEDIYFRWPESETAGYNEMTFELWEYNASGWAYKNAALGELKNFLYYYWLNPNSDYAILEGVRDRNCSYINASGTYLLPGNAEGEGYSISDYNTEYACILISSDDVIFDCNGYNITNEHVVYDNDFAIFVNGTEDKIYNNITIRNCPNISEYDGGITFEYSNWNTVSNVTIDAEGQSASDGVVLYSSNYSSITGMRAYDLWFYGIQMMMGSGYNNISDCLVDNAESGFYVLHSGTSFNTFDNNTARNCANSGFRMLESAPQNTYTNNIAHDNTYGFEIEGTYHHFENNTAYDNTDTNFWVSMWASPAPSNLTFINNTADGGGAGNCFYLSDGDNHTYINNTAYDCAIGFSYLDLFGFPPGMGHRFYNNTVSANGIGFGINLAHNSTFADNIVIGNTNAGLDIGGSDNLTFSGTKVSNNAIQGGVSITDSNLSFTDAHFFGSAATSFFVESVASTSNITLTNATFDNPQGIYQNYTNVDLSDIVEVGTAYYLNWSSQPAALPADYVSFAEKYLDITATAGVVSIDSISFNWLDLELPGYNESVFELLVFNASGWTTLNNTPDTAANDFVQTNINPASTFAILQLNDSNGPQVALGEPINDYMTNSTTINFNFTATDDHAPSMNCSLLINGTYNDSLLALNNTLTNIVASVGEGVWNWSINCLDSANNSNTSAGRNFTIDLTIPFVNMTDPTNTTYAVAAVPLNFIATDDFSGVGACWYTLNGGAPVGIAGCANTTFSPGNGYYDFILYVQDNAGNINSTNTSFTVNAATPPSGGGGSEEKSKGSVGTDVSEGGWLTVTVTYKGIGIEGATVELYQYQPSFGFVESGATDGDGEAFFQLPGPGTYRIYVYESSYSFNNPYQALFEIEMGCTENAQCLDNESCAQGSCQAVSTAGCGYIANHTWIGYDCCEDDDCPGNQLCSGHQCTSGPHVEGSCSNDNDCGGTEYCESGRCRPVPGDCGYAANHIWNHYECCADEDCESDEVCREHACIPGQDFHIETDEEGFIGDQHTIIVYRDGQPFSNGEVVIVTPDGQEFRRSADGNGRVILPLEVEGEYEVRLLFENAVVDSAAVGSLSKPTVQEEDKPFAFLGDLAVVCPVAIILLAAIALFYILYKRRKGEKFRSVTAKKKQ